MVSMNERVFLDTGYLIALEAADDQHHKDALRHWKSFAKHRPRLVRTSYVFDEVVTFFNSRGRHGKAVELGHRLLVSPSIRFFHIDISLFEEGWHHFQSRPDKRYSLTDCISFVVMERESLREALTFDDHFAQAGFLVLPGS
jgi:predicted nucleic acid-binding protein